LHTITGVCTPACLLAASISVEAVTPPLVGLDHSKSYFQTRVIVSYPTVKSRLTRIADSLEFVEHDPMPSKSEILERLQRGEITAEDAIREMETLR
jgi:hypothetical protein